MELVLIIKSIYNDLLCTYDKDPKNINMCLLMYDSMNSLCKTLKCGRKHCFSNSSLIYLYKQHLISRKRKLVQFELAISKFTKENEVPEDNTTFTILTSSFISLLGCNTQYFTKSFLWLSDFDESSVLALLYFVSLGISLIKCTHIPSCLKLYSCSLKLNLSEELLQEQKVIEDFAFYGDLNFSCTCTCVEEHSECVVIYYSITRSQDKKQANKEIHKNLQAGALPFTEEKLAGSSSQQPVPPQSSTTNTSTKHLPPSLEVATPVLGATNDSLTGQDQTGGLTEATGYTTSSLPGATVSHFQHYGADFDKDQPLSREERRKDVQVVSKEKDVDTILESHRKDQISSSKKLSSELQATAKPSAKPRTSANVDRPPRFPRKACVVHKNEQYSLDPKLLSLPRATKYLVKVRTEISPGRFMAKLELHCAR